MPDIVNDDRDEGLRGRRGRREDRRRLRDFARCLSCATGEKTGEEKVSQDETKYGPASWRPSRTVRNETRAARPFSLRVTSNRKPHLPAIGGVFDRRFSGLMGASILRATERNRWLLSSIRQPCPEPERRLCPRPPLSAPSRFRWPSATAGQRIPLCPALRRSGLGFLPP